MTSDAVSIWQFYAQGAQGLTPLTLAEAQRRILRMTRTQSSAEEAGPNTLVLACIDPVAHVLQQTAAGKAPADALEIWATEAEVADAMIAGLHPQVPFVLYPWEGRQDHDTTLGLSSTPVTASAAQYPQAVLAVLSHKRARALVRRLALPVEEALPSVTDVWSASSSGGQGATLLQEQVIQLQHTLEQYYRENEAIYRSTSWRITAPLRFFGRFKWR